MGSWPTPGSARQIASFWTAFCLVAVPVHRLTRPEQLAFWINLYNAQTVALVLDQCPVSSIGDIKFKFSRSARGSMRDWEFDPISARCDHRDPSPAPAVTAR